jgi:hypothetical protein
MAALRYVCQLRVIQRHTGMSAFMSAFPPIATKKLTSQKVRIVPKGDIGRRYQDSIVRSEDRTVRSSASGVEASERTAVVSVLAAIGMVLFRWIVCRRCKRHRYQYERFSSGYVYAYPWRFKGRLRVLPTLKAQGFIQ